MNTWEAQVKALSDAIDRHILAGCEEELALGALARAMGYSPFHMTRMFKHMSGMTLRQYLRLRRLAFALEAVRDSRQTLLTIAVAYGFSSHQAFTRAFRETYGITPTAYRARPRPLVVRGKLRTFDHYHLSMEEIAMVNPSDKVKTYFVTIPAHTLLYIQNTQSHGYWDFWEKQDSIPGQDCNTICSLLDTVHGKLDGKDGVVGAYSGQIMAYLTDEKGQRAEAYGIRLAAGSTLEAPPLLSRQVPEGSYIVFEHGPFNFETESETVDQRIQETMAAFQYEGTGYAPDEGKGRVTYFYFDPQQHEKRILPVKRVK